ncbi:UNVERIFIED_CONTAM: hypothetical protein Slati_0086100 [Sesamum latifolium]|uniref:Uncharacterized protein n=1 Tax=Sesamum latifolium TaxID=2727402 RepID=A0AAW2Y905_9LAMI
MQKANISCRGLDATSAADISSASAASPMHFSHSNPFLFPTSPTYVNSVPSFYSSLFQNYSSDSPPTPRPLTAEIPIAASMTRAASLSTSSFTIVTNSALLSSTIPLRSLTPSVARMSLFASPTRISRTVSPYCTRAIAFSLSSTDSTLPVPQPPLRVPPLIRLQLSLLLSTIEWRGGAPSESPFRRAFLCAPVVI